MTPLFFKGHHSWSFFLALLGDVTIKSSLPLPRRGVLWYAAFGSAAAGTDKALTSDNAILEDLVFGCTSAAID